MRRTRDAGRVDALNLGHEPEGQGAARPSLAARRRRQALAGAPPPPTPAAQPSGHDSTALSCALELLSPLLWAQDPDLSQLRGSPLGQALAQRLHARYPNLEEYQDLILAELVESTRAPGGRQALSENPDAMMDQAVRRAMVCLAQVRVALRRAVRCELAAPCAGKPREPVPPPDGAAT